MLTEIVFFDTLRSALWVAAVTSLPILTVALIAGVLVGLFQALTSIQEMTLTFVPKLAAIAVTFWMTMGFMSSTLANFLHTEILPLIAGI